jgi:hypothetical protein
MIEQKFGKDPESVPAFFRFRAIGIEYAQAKVGFVAVHQDQDAIGANAVMDITNGPDIFF